MRWPSVLSQLRSFLRKRHGNVAIVFGLSLPLLVGAAGLGVETSYWYYKHIQLQAAANQSAYAGALELRAGSTHSTVISVATTTATNNGFNSAAGSLTLNSPP